METKILVVDDELDLELLIRGRFRKQIHNKEFSFSFAHNGLEALEMLEKDADLHIILTDIRMPVMDGLALLESLRTLNRLYRVVVISAFADMTNIRTAMNRGASDFVTKPIDFQDLEITLNNTIKQYQEMEKAVSFSIDNARLYTDIMKLNEHLNLLNKSFQRFVPEDFLNLLQKKSIADVELGDNSEKTMSVLFTDIRNFTTRSETMTPKENFIFINSFLNVIAPIIRKHNGFIDKYIGDAIMALYPGSVDDTIRCALEMQRTLKEYNSQHSDMEPINIGIGINTGLLMLGIVGENQRLGATVISDTVNVAARVESLTKEYSEKILITEETFKNLTAPEQFNIQMLGNTHIKGKSKEITIYKVVE